MPRELVTYPDDRNQYADDIRPGWKSRGPCRANSKGYSDHDGEEDQVPPVR